MQSLVPSSGASTMITRSGQSSQESERTTSQHEKRGHHLISQDDNDDIKPFSFSKVPPPKKEIDHASFKEAELAARSIPTEIISIIDQSSVKHGDIGFIKDMAVAAMFPKASTGVKLGLKGDSGVAPTRLAILKEWVKDVFIFEHSDAQLGDDHFEQEKKASDTAIEGLFSLFCDRDECQDSDLIKEFLSTSKSEDDERTISTLAGWTEELLSSLEAVSGKVFISGITPQDIQAQIRRVFHDQPILADDVILVDLPGAQDTNQIRSQASMRYLDDVDYIGIVARSDRLQTDDNVQKYLQDAFRRKHGASTLVIATNSDSVDMSSTSLDDKISTADTVHEMNLITLREKLHATSVEYQQITRDLKKDHVRQDRNRLITMLDQQSDLESRKNLLEEKLFEYCVEMRNEDTSQSIRQNYHDLTKDPVPLPVFCVSNLVYAKYVSGNYEPPMMGFESTNIPALRAFLYALPAFRKFKAFEHHHQHVLPSLVNHLEMICSQTKVDSHEELRNIIQSASVDVPSDVTKSFKYFFDEAILPVIAIIKTNKAAYVTYATDQLTKWSNWPSQTFKTFCTHRGNWSTPKVGKHDWNEEMLKPLIQDVNSEANGWEDATSNLSANISSKLSTRITELIGKIQGPEGSLTDPMKLFVEELQRQPALLDQICQARVKKLQRDLIAIKERITNTQDMEQSYFVKLLEKTYDDCGRIFGLCSPSSRQEMVSKISKEVRGPFLEMCENANEDAQKVIQRHERKLIQEVTHVFESFNRTFVHGFMAEGLDTPELKQLREKLRAEIPHWRGILTGKINRHLEDCREYAKSG
ncbi:Tat pathway signal sequence [Lasiodiplodia theobromae]|uniref:Tat pathway signal sequence n=1 Tax=Lasiodiplodia theobromae TaxID=45133 RepID=UPI0015C38D1A|nr:Tat pathway signal sequence [Lasiodiplodia theobromae]KAF4544045.1 Tat pathway signal sequence [Lasiodiplodia theobromae]